MKKRIFNVVCVVFPGLTVAQTANQGILTVLPQTQIATHANFSNQDQGVVKNDGTFYFYADFDNQGIYSFDAKQKQSYAVFEPLKSQTGVQRITGDAPSEFYDVLFHNESVAGSFDLSNDMSISGTANFLSGIVQIDSLQGALVFQNTATSINVSDKSHADGQVEKIGNQDFKYPIGDQGVYRFAKILSPKSTKDSFLATYYLKNSNAKMPHAKRAGVIELINNKEYWSIERDAKTSSDVMLTLSWDPRTTPGGLLEDPEKQLRIVRWDASQDLWVDLGGVVDMDAKTVTTPTVVDGYGVFTLARVKKELVLDGDVVIYNGVTPNGDGLNDHFVIDNIERFPTNKVEIYNRWGVKVYATTGYNNTDNNFKGYSHGRVTVAKGEMLPTGTYYYIVEYLYSDAQGSRMIKKSGYLHLETQ